MRERQGEQAGFRLEVAEGSEDNAIGSFNLTLPIDVRKTGLLLALIK